MGDLESNIEEALQNCEEIRKIAEQLLECEDKTTSDQLRHSLLRKGLGVKPLHREVYSAIEDLKDTINRNNRELDGYRLRVDNLLYEKDNLVREIINCKKFKTSEGEINLIPLSEFERDAPVELQVSANESEHKLHLNRLAFELDERKKLREELSNLKKKTEEKKKENEKAENFLLGLGEQINTIVDATRPLQEYFQMSQFSEDAIRSYAAVLPQPLYIIFERLHNYIVGRSVPGLEASIEGSEEDAAVFKELQQQKKAKSSLSDTRPMEIEEESENEEAEFETVAGDDGEEREEGEEDGEESLSHRASLGHVSTTDEDSAADVHPLSVVLTITLPKPQAAVQLLFGYTPTHDVVFVSTRVPPSTTTVADEGRSHTPPPPTPPDTGAKISPSPDNVLLLPVRFMGSQSSEALPQDQARASPLSDLLHNIYPGDDGQLCPCPAGLYKKPTFMNLLPGQPYLWAHWLAGIHTFPEHPSSLTTPAECSAVTQARESAFDRYTSLTYNIGSLISRIMLRIRARAHLNVLLSKLTHGESFLNLIPPQDRIRSSTVMSPWALAPATLYTESDRQHHLLIYTTTLRCSDTKVYVQCRVGPEYPLRPPLFAFSDSPFPTTQPSLASFSLERSAQCNNQLKALESEVNYFVLADIADRGENSYPSMLAYQLLRLLMGTEVYVQTRTTTASASHVAFTRPRAGRDRLPPYVFNKDLGLFDQRG
eukprot:GCRY01002789.1.p1 GENE.GCRY01002789.1~~GCRY01002789.1.p1  ORF type:complete len:713 (-),score=212.96 GCRY01002789.1:97-2235(-)